MPNERDGEELGSSERPVTMQDVAKRAGVHQTTVSIALRNHPSIPEETRRRIQRLAREMGYRKDPGIEAFNSYRLGRLGAGPGQRIGFLSDAASEAEFFENPALAAYFRGAAQRAEKIGVGLTLALACSAVERNLSLADYLRSEGCSSLIAGSLADARSVVLRWGDWVAVGIDTFPLENSIDLVAPDYRRSTRRAVAELYERGFRRIGFIAASETDQTLGNLCQIGYLIECRMRSLPILQRSRGRVAWTEESLRDWVLEDDLDAVVCLDAAAVELVRKACVLTSRPLAIATLDRSEETADLPGIELRREDVGAGAVDALMEKVKSGWLRVGLAPTVTYFATEWVREEAELLVPVPVA